MSKLPEILVIGGTGAQGMPVVTSLAKSGRYRIRVLTRDVNSSRAKVLGDLPGVSLIQGQVHDQKSLHAAFSGVYGAWVNTDGFTLGEKNELFYGFRAYEIARHEKVKHYVWANSDYALKKAGWEEKYHWGHNDAKGRLGDFILAQPQTELKSTLFTTGPYMDMLFDGMFVPAEDTDGTVVWANPAGSGKIPLIALEDVGAYVLWIFDNPNLSSGMDLEVATDEVSFKEIAEVFTRVTGRRAIHRELPMNQYMDSAEPYPNAPVNWMAGSKGVQDEAIMTWRENFTAWWLYWGGGLGASRNFVLLDEIHPARIRTLEEWMRKVNYQGKPKAVLKGMEDVRDRHASTDSQWAVK